MASAELDRLAVLRSGGPERLARFLAAVPPMAEMLAGRGPLAGLSPYGFNRRPQPAANLQDVARAISSPYAIACTVMGCEELTNQVLATVVWLGGVATTGQILRIAPGLGEDALDRCARQLDDCLLAEYEPDRSVRLRTGVAEQLRPPGYHAAYHLEFAPHDQLGRHLRAFGVKASGRKVERVEQVLKCLRDPVAVRRVIDGLSRPARALFDQLVAEFDMPIREVDSRAASWYSIRSDSALGELVDAGLVGADRSYRDCYVWFEVKVALAGSLFPSWVRPAPPEAVPLGTDAAPGIPSVLRALDSLMSGWRAQPAAALKSGGIGATVVRAAAKAAGVPAGEMGLLVTLGADLDLVAVFEAGRQGRGRKQTVDLRWRPTARWDHLAALAPLDRWRVLVQAWLDSRQLSAGTELPTRYERLGDPLESIVQRSATVAYFAALPGGTGVPLEALPGELSARCAAFLTPEQVAPVIAAARFLGLVTDGPIVGLTDLGREFVTGEAVRRRADAVDHFVVQADHTVVAPPALTPEVEERLAAIAELESTGGARVYRLSEHLIARSLDRGHQGAELVAFLAEHSSVPVPANVTRMVRDIADRHGVLRVGSAASWVISDDPVALATALRIKAAKLHQLNETTAVSDLNEAELTAALRSKGLTPTSDAEVVARFEAEAHVQAVAGTPGGPAFALRDRLVPSVTDLAELAATLHAAPIPPPEQRRRPTNVHQLFPPADLEDLDDFDDVEFSRFLRELDSFNQDDYDQDDDRFDG